MRMRLRAPDEPEAESGYEFGDVNASAPSTPEHSHLPPLDVGSPEYIEERLENLKRRPNWGDYLDQYVEDHPDSDSEAGDFDDISTLDNAGFIRSTLWSLLVVAFAPLLILCAPCLKHKSYGFWPLGCRSMNELFSCALANVIFMMFGLVLLYWTICRELPDVFNVNNTLVKLNVQVDEIQRAADTCHAALLQWDRMVAQELCMPVGIDVALLLLNTLLLLHCHRRWARYLMVLMVVMFVVDVPTQLYDATFPAPEIHKVDPTFAMVDEELLVALDGKNLKPGGSVAWVAYWGCATTSNVDACDKQFASTFEAGNVAVTFKSLDHFIPCYRDPPNPLKAQDYQCFENIRIRVKDMQSIPGWSRTAPQAAAVYDAVKPESTLNKDWDNVEASSFEHEEQLDHYTVNPERRETEASLNAVKIGIASAAGSSSETLPTTSNGECELKKNTAVLSEERGTQENESVPRSSLEAEQGADNTEAAIRNEKLAEAEVMPDAVVKMRAIDSELQNASQSEETLAPVEEVLQGPATRVEELRISSDTEVEVEVNKPKKPEEDVPGYNVEDSDFSMVELLLEDAIENEEIMIIDDEEELSTMVVVVDDDSLQVVIDNHKELELAIEVETHTERSTYEAQSDEVSTPAATGQEEEELKLATEVEKQRKPKPSTEAKSDEVSTSAATAQEKEELDLATEVEKHTVPNKYEAQLEEVSTSAASTQKKDLIASGSKEELSTPEYTTSPAKKALSKLSEALSKISDSSGFASDSEAISKKQKHSKRQGPRSRHTKKNSEPANVDAAENTAAVV
ncbi:hypothetical protein V7S43_008291 [Phytophthora oleae]|uniref:Uncharacterized protein n=1 Tax=Phytophthora oleae TaxID=2107226 RepID=A0ABD3FIB4_9STRA